MVRYCIATASLILLLLTVLANPILAQTLTGRVFDALTRAPITDAWVSTGSHQVRTDDEGRFTINTEADDRQIVVRATGYWRSCLFPQGPLEIAMSPFDPKALYLSFWGAGHRGLRNKALKQLDESRLNALVIDVKGDRGMLSYRSRLPLAKAIGAQKTITLPRLRPWLTELREQGIYTIARIVVFKDDLLAKARPDLAVKNADGDIWQDNEGLRWADPFSQEAWDYNLAVAQEAAELGFDEIMFDYIRFPDTSGLRFGQQNTEAGRIGAINGFLQQAQETLKPQNVFTSASIFGYVCWNRNDTYIGQQLEALAPYVDILAPMLYPSGFQYGVGELKNPVANPYEIIARSLQMAQKRSGLPSQRFRPWLQAFRDYAFDRRRFGEEEIERQVAASRAFGANGWMLWNARNVYQGLESLQEPMLTGVDEHVLPDTSPQDPA